MPFEEFRKNGYRLQPLAPAPTPAAPAPCNTPAPVPRPVDDKVVDALQVRRGGEEGVFEHRYIYSVVDVL